MTLSRALLLLFFSFCIALPCALAQLPTLHPGEVLVSWKPGVTPDALLRRFAARNEGSITLKKKVSTLLDIWLLQMDVSNKNRAMEWLAQQPEVRVVQWNAEVQIREAAPFLPLPFGEGSAIGPVLPNDPLFPKQWHHLNDGSSGGLPDADLDSDLAWEIATGGLSPAGDTLVVAVIDGGVAFEHPDLAPNRWRNHAEIPLDGLDNDENGYVDDARGWNVLKKNDDISGTATSHGTPVSGIIGARGNNGLGVSGVNWQVKIMFVTIGNTIADVLAAYDYVLQARRRYNATNGKQGAFVVAVNNSFGINYGQPSEAPLWCMAFDSLGAAGILSVAATANLPIDVDVLGDLPTGCTSPYLLGVTNLTRSDKKAASAAWGKESIDLGAYGDGVVSTAAPNGYDAFGGTSFAAPEVTGAVALLYAAPCPSLLALAKNDPAAAALRVKKWVMESTTPNAALQSITRSGGRLNLGALLQAYEEECPACPAPFAVEASETGATSAALSWKQSTENQSIRIRWRVLGTLDWKQESNVKAPFTLNNLSACTRYEVALQALCSNSSSSEWSPAYPFRTAGCCEAPAQIKVSSIHPAFVELAWQPVTVAQGYRIRVRPMGTDAWTFFETSVHAAKIEDLQPCTDYEAGVQTRCGAGVYTAFSAPVFFKTMGCGVCTDLSYCSAAADQATEEWIAGIQIGPWLHTSNKGGAGYQNFTSEPPGFPEFQPNSLSQVTVTPGFSGQSFKEYFRVFVDFNADGDFEDEGELAYDPGFAHNGPLSGTIKAPNFKSFGMTRMRVLMKFANSTVSPPKACESFSFGQVKDYCVRLVPMASSVQSIEHSGALRIFPQPASQSVTIAFSDAGADVQEPYTLQVWDAVGRLMPAQAAFLQENAAQLDVSNWLPGIYLVQVVAAGEVFWREMVVGGGTP